MDSKNFRTKTIIKPRENYSVDNTWVVALDVGYSAVKIFSPNMVACFPAFATKLPKGGAFVSKVSDNSIMYKDNESDDIWLVGEVAQNNLANGDTSNSEMALYGRNRYINDMFMVVARCGIALGMMNNEFGSPEGRKILLSTGLPEKYMSDERELKTVLGINHEFSIRIGNGDWVDIKQAFTKDDISVMSQPKGTLLSICVDRNCRFIKDAESYLKSSGIIFDPGFGTLDVFFMVNGYVAPNAGETLENLGMKRVLQETSALLKERYDIEVPVPNMQKFLETGKVTSYDRLNDEVKMYDINDVLAEANKKVATEAIKTVKHIIGDPTQYNYIVFTGGTSHAWITMLDQAFNYPNLKKIYGNQNDDLGFVFSNVRGYYMNSMLNIKKKMREEQK